MDPPVDMPRLLMAWGLLAWFGASLALVIGCGTAHSETIERLWHPAAYLLFPLSGAAFMVDWMPSRLQEFVLWIPMVDGVEMLRDGYFGSAVRTHYSAEYLTLCCGLLTLAGLALVKNAGRHIEMKIYRADEREQDLSDPPGASSGSRPRQSAGSQGAEDRHLGRNGAANPH